MTYHKSLYNSHTTVIINTGQPFKFAVPNSASLAHVSKCIENPPRHNEHNRTGIAEFGPIPKQL